MIFFRFNFSLKKEFIDNVFEIIKQDSIIVYNITIYIIR